MTFVIMHCEIMFTVTLESYEKKTNFWANFITFLNTKIASLYICQYPNIPKHSCYFFQNPCNRTKKYDYLQYLISY